VLGFRLCKAVGGLALRGPCAPPGQALEGLAPLSFARKDGPVSGASRFDVRSPNGTSLAVWVDGSGPPLVLVHGSMCDHTRFDPLVAELRQGMTTFAMDRRGFGASADTGGYAIEREFEDVAAVVDAVAERAGGPVALWGHSYGDGCAMGAAVLASNIHHLILYEPGLGLAYPSGSIEAIEEALGAGDREAAIFMAFGALDLTEDERDAMRSSPMWPVRLASAPTLPRECRTEESWTYRPRQFDAVTARTLMLTGSETPPDVRDLAHRAAAAIPNTEIRVLEGHAHFAFHDDPAMVAAIIRQFTTVRQYSRPLATDP
jgi:pimeloyl-ACP methyl ester carboxylesterase